MSKYENMNLIEFMEKCGTEEKCREKLFNLRWPDGHICDKCGCKESKKISTRNEYICGGCGKQFSLISGTVFEGTKLSIQKWFCAIFLMSKDKRGISALELSRELNINYKSARLMSINLKNAMTKREMEYMLEGIIEMDEFYIGKGSNGKRGRGTDKSKVLISLSKNEQKQMQYLKLKVCDDLKSDTVNKFVKQNIKAGSTIISDGFKSYNSLLEIDMKHEVEISGKNDEYLSLHTIISNIKSFVLGTYHGLDTDELQICLNEFCYRFNRRYCHGSLFERLLNLCLKSTHLRRIDIVCFDSCG